MRRPGRAVVCSSRRASVAGGRAVELAGPGACPSRLRRAAAVETSAAAADWWTDASCRLPLPLPRSNLRPDDRAVVNLPLDRASTDAPGADASSPSSRRRSRRSRSPRASGGGGAGATGASDSTTTWPGRAYDGTDPRTSPGHYVGPRLRCTGPFARSAHRRHRESGAAATAIAGMGSPTPDRRHRCSAASSRMRSRSASTARPSRATEPQPRPRRRGGADDLHDAEPPPRRPRSAPRSR